MQKEDILKLFTSQRLSIEMIRFFGDQIIESLQNAYLDDPASLQTLKTLNSKEYNMLDTYFKISSLLLKVYPLEHKIAGSELIKNMKKITIDENQLLPIDQHDLDMLKELITDEEKDEKTK